MTAQNAMGPQMHSEALRRLSPLERLFDAIDQTNGFNFSRAVTFRGNVAHSGWVAAFAQVQRRHPFLRAGPQSRRRAGTVRPAFRIFSHPTDI